MLVTLFSVGIIIFYEIGIWKVLIFFPSIIMTISLLESYSKTCIVYSSIGIKHMGEKYEREKDTDFLKQQRLRSIKIVINGTIASLLITYLVYLIP